jgi:hypothetical protein
MRCCRAAVAGSGQLMSHYQEIVMIVYRVSLSALVPLLLVTALAACTVRVKGTAGASAPPVRHHGHVSQSAPDLRHGHVNQPAPDSAHSACAVHTDTGCYWMENESGRYCWVPAEWADTYEGCYAMDSCDGGKGQLMAAVTSGPTALTQSAPAGPISSVSHRVPAGASPRRARGDLASTGSAPSGSPGRRSCVRTGMPSRPATSSPSRSSPSQA